MFRTALVTLILLTAVLAQFGDDVAARIKRVGPVELFSEQVSDLVATLERLDLTMKAMSVKEEFAPTRGRLSLEERQKYRDADRYVSQVNFSNVKINGAAKRRFCQLLLAVAYGAFRENDLWRARARLRYLAEFSESYMPGDVQYSLGFTCLWCALHGKAQLEDPDHEMAIEEREAAERRQRNLFEEAGEHFRKSAEVTPWHHFTHFWLGFAQDELGRYELAIEANNEALRIRPQLVQARYNKAVSLVKWKKFEEALRTFQEIDGPLVEDEEAQECYGHAFEDPELDSLRRHPTLGKVFLAWLRQRKK